MRGGRLWQGPAAKPIAVAAAVVTVAAAGAPEEFVPLSGGTATADAESFLSAWAGLRARVREAAS